MLVGDSSLTFVERAFGLFSRCENYRCGTAPDFDRTSPVFQLATTACLYGMREYTWQIDSRTAGKFPLPIVKDLQRLDRSEVV